MLGRLQKESVGSGEIARHADALPVHEGQIGLGIGIAAVGGKPEPVRRRVRVGGTCQPMGEGSFKL